MDFDNQNKKVRSGKVNSKTKEPVIKPEYIHDNNCNMGGVDQSDTMMVNVESVRPCQSGKTPTLQQFHLAIGRQLLQENFEPRPQKKGGRPSP